jgi:hypothetical protein
MKKPKTMLIEKPLVIMSTGEDDNIVCHIFPQPNYDYKAYGLLIYDLVRHAADAFGVDEDDVWEWVLKERANHTTEITRAS